MPAASCVPASNFSGTGAQTASCSVHRVDHLAAGEEGFCLVEQLGAPPEHAHTHGAERPCGPEKARKSAPMARTSTGMCGIDLRGVHHKVATVGVYSGGQLLKWQAAAKDVGDVSGRHDLGARADLGRDLGVGELARLGGVEVDELGPRPHGTLAARG